MDFFLSDASLFIGLACIFGLLVGSFLNVVVYRLPVMMENDWAAECSEYANSASNTGAAETAPATATASPTFNLMRPRSRCQQCNHQLRWYENIPVFSYLALRGKCSTCHVSISPRYPLVELATAALFGFCTWRWGFTATGLAWCGFSAMLLALALIDWDTTLLPDSITLPLLWAGLLLSAAHITSVSLQDAVWGAAAAYFSLWLIYWVFKLVTGKEGMGYGDFKLYAALGAWFGWQALIPLILLASISGAIVGLVLKFSKQLRAGGYVPFGPFLAMAGFLALFFGPSSILKMLGLFQL